MRSKRSSNSPLYGVSEPKSEEHIERSPPPGEVAVASGTPEPYHRYAIYRGDLLLGTTNLEVTVEPGVRAAGVFHPTKAYSSVAPVFMMYESIVVQNDKALLRNFVARRDALGLEIWRKGVQLDATVELISKWSAGQYVVHVLSRDERMWHWRFPDS